MFIRYTSHSNRADNVPVIINHDGGQDTETVNMKTNGGVFNSLGTYNFTPGIGQYVEIQTTGTNGYVIADAVKLVSTKWLATNLKTYLEEDTGTKTKSIHKPDGTIWHFGSDYPFKLTSIENIDGHELAFEYDTEERLESITTPAGREISFVYTTAEIGGKKRLQQIDLGEEPLVQFSYTTSGNAGRLDEVEYLEDESGYTYSYSTLGGESKYLSEIADLEGRIVEEYTFENQPYMNTPVVTESVNGYGNYSYAYYPKGSSYADPNAPGERHTAVTRNLDASTTESYYVSYDPRGRILNNTDTNCSCCTHGTQVAYDYFGNQYLDTQKNGKVYQSSYGIYGNKLYQREVSVAEGQTISSGSSYSDTFDNGLDPARWKEYRRLGSDNGNAIPHDGMIQLRVENSDGPEYVAGFVSNFRLSGDFDVSLTFSNLDGLAQGNNFKLAVVNNSDVVTGLAYPTVEGMHFAAEVDENDSYRRSGRLSDGTIFFGSGQGSLWYRRGVLRIVRSGNVFTAYRDGTSSMGSTTLNSIGSEFYIAAVLGNFNQNGYPALQVDIEDITINSGTVIADVYTEVTGTEVEYSYDNPLLPSAVTQVVEPSLFSGYEKSTIYDYDDPGASGDTSTPNENPTKKLYRTIENAYTDNDHNGTPELVTRITTYEYYGASSSDGLNGQLKSVDGPETGDVDKVTYRYDASGQLEEVENSLEQITTYGDYGIYGNAQSVTDINGLETTLIYSRRGQVISRTFDPGTSPHLNLTSSSIYENDLLLESTSPKGARQAQSYDSYRRLDVLESLHPSNSTVLESKSYGYNYSGSRTLEEFEDSASQTTYSTSTTYGNSTDPSTGPTYLYRDYVKVETPTGSSNFTTTWLDESGREATRQDPSGHLTLYDYNTDGLLADVTEVGVSAGGGTVDHVTHYTYDDDGNVSTVTDPEELETTYEWDDFGRLLEVESPDSGLTQYEYDIAGRLTKKTQAVGSGDETETIYSYDDLGRIQAVVYEEDGRDVLYFYDGIGDSGVNVYGSAGDVSLSQSNAEGRLSAIAMILDPTDPNERIITTYEYDPRGLLIKEQKYLNAPSPHTTQYAYDDDGNLESMTYPRGLVVDYIYGGSDPGKVTKITADEGGGAFDIADNITYFPFGDVKELDYGNGESLEFERTSAYWLNKINVPGKLFRQYGRDSRGNITSVKYSTSTTDETYTYDQVSRLTEATGDWGTFDYEFDKNGNRTEVDEGTSETYSYNTNTNQISSVETTTFSYDGLGNLTGKGDYDYTYGPDDRLLSVANNLNPVADFLHGPDGRRIQKIPASGPTVLYHWDQAGNLTTETYVTDDPNDPNATGNVSMEFVYLGAHRLAAIASQGLSGDFLGSFTASAAPLPSQKQGPWLAWSLPSGHRMAQMFLLMVMGLTVLMGVGMAKHQPRWFTASVMLVFGASTLFVWLKTIKEAEAIAVPSSAYFFINGHLGQPLALMDNSGNIAWSTNFEPYGDLDGESGSITVGDPNTTGMEWAPLFRYPGQMEDLGTDLFYNQWRYYKPSLSYYTRPDPAAQSSTHTPTYYYANNNPQRFVDPFGLYPMPDGAVKCSTLSQPVKCKNYDFVQDAMDKVQVAFEGWGAGGNPKERASTQQHRADTGKNPDGSQWSGPSAATTFDTNQSIISWVNPNHPGFIEYDQDPCIIWCACEHENQHLVQMAGAPGSDFEGWYKMTKSGEPGFLADKIALAEANAYGVQKTCLENYLIEHHNSTIY